MKINNYDLAVAYRIYPEITRSPPIYVNNKYKLSKFCLKSFKDSLGRLKIKIWALLDNCPEEYEELFREHFEDSDLEIINLSGIGNKATFDLQMKILLEQNVSEIIYFAEDDYYYFPNQFEKMISFLKNDSDVDFLTPYDHVDYYTNELHKYKSKIKIFENKHWRSVASTCCTFLTTKDNLLKTKNVFSLYSEDKLGDLSTFLCLTKKWVFNLFKITRFYVKNRELFYHFYIAWRYGWKQILFGKRWKLWGPMPTIGTHMECEFLAPTIEWDKIFKEKL